MKVLLGMMIDRGTQGLEVGAGTTGFATLLYIGACNLDEWREVQWPVSA
ncbi:MAG TPA: hypothetical protein VGJ20_27820 [Xanthobacteraceae bacterium]